MVREPGVGKLDLSIRVGGLCRDFDACKRIQDFLSAKSLALLSLEMASIKGNSGLCHAQASNLLCLLASHRFYKTHFLDQELIWTCWTAVKVKPFLQ